MTKPIALALSIRQDGQAPVVRFSVVSTETGLEIWENGRQVLFDNPIVNYDIVLEEPPGADSLESWGAVAETKKEPV